MLLTLLILLQGAPPSGGARITRVSDPVTVCMIIATVESMKTPNRLSGFANNPKIERTDPTATVTWNRVKAGEGDAKVICQLNSQTRQVTSITVAEREILAQPQPF